MPLQPCLEPSCPPGHSQRCLALLEREHGGSEGEAPSQCASAIVLTQRHLALSGTAKSKPRAAAAKAKLAAARPAQPLLPWHCLGSGHGIARGHQVRCGRACPRPWDHKIWHCRGEELGEIPGGWERSLEPGACSVLAQSRAGRPNLLRARGVRGQTAAPAAPLLLLQAVPNP